VYSHHANLRVSLQRLRERQRSAGAFKQVGGNSLSAVWVKEAAEKVLSLCVECRRGRRSSSVLLRHAAFVWPVRHGQTAFALNAGISGLGLATGFVRSSLLPEPTAAPAAIAGTARTAKAACTAGRARLLRATRAQRTRLRRGTRRPRATATLLALEQILENLLDLCGVGVVKLDGIDVLFALIDVVQL